MEQPGNVPETPEEKLKNFRGEIRSIVEEEQKTRKTVHFQELNPEELSPEDMDIWEKVSDRSVTREDFDRYRGRTINANLEKRQRSLSQTKIEFLKYVANKVSEILIEREIGGEANED
jgi:hypothetical protein